MPHIAAISLVVPDYDQAIAHYCDGLGFDLIEDTPLGPDKRWVLIAPKGAKETRLLLARGVKTRTDGCDWQSGGRTGVSDPAYG